MWRELNGSKLFALFERTEERQQRRHGHTHSGSKREASAQMAGWRAIEIARRACWLLQGTAAKSLVTAGNENFK